MRAIAEVIDEKAINMVCLALHGKAGDFSVTDLVEQAKFDLICRARKDGKLSAVFCGMRSEHCLKVNHLRIPNWLLHIR
jgi:hypothetical protein